MNNQILSLKETAKQLQNSLNTHSENARLEMVTESLKAAEETNNPAVKQALVSDAQKKLDGIVNQ